MRMCKFIGLGLAIFYSLSSTCYGQAYLGSTLYETDADTNSFFGESELHAVGILAGYQVNPWFSVEFRYNRGAGDDEQNTQIFLGQSIQVTQIKDIKSVFGVLAVPTQSDLQPYLLLGYSKVIIDQTDVSVSNNNPTTAGPFPFIFASSRKLNDSGISYGIGAFWEINSKWHLNLEYQQIIDHQLKLAGPGIGLKYWFN